MIFLTLPHQPSTRSRPGDVIRMDKHGQNFASADIARIRLRDLVRRDREAAQDGRWVRLRPNHLPLQQWRLLSAQRAFCGLPPTPPPTVDDSRPRYRWEVRR